MAKTQGAVTHAPTPETREMVKAMTACGVRQSEVASILGISIDTLAKYYRKELDTSAALANTKIAQTLYQKALAGDTACMIFWLKTRAKWQEVVQVETPPDTGIRFVINRPPRAGNQPN